MRTQVLGSTMLQKSVINILRTPTRQSSISFLNLMKRVEKNSSI